MADEIADADTCPTVAVERLAGNTPDTTDTDNRRVAQVHAAPPNDPEDHSKRGAVQDQGCRQEHRQETELHAAGIQLRLADDQVW